MKHKKTVSPSAILKIDAFWKWFSKNRVQIEMAIRQRENKLQILTNLDKRISNISKYVSFLLKGPNADDTKIFIIIFTVGGQLKKVRWAKAFENSAPSFPNWKIQALIQPCENLEVIKSGNDNPIIYQDFELKISEMYFNLKDYDIYKKNINIVMYLQNYKYHYENEYLEEIVHIALEELLGEIAFRNSISNIEIAQIPNKKENLLPLYELPQYIDLIKNSNRKLKI